jgi:hypothetical protein
MSFRTAQKNRDQRRDQRRTERPTGHDWGKPVATGHKPTDERRASIKNFEDQPDKPVGVDAGAWLGDFIEGLVKRGLSPTAMMFLGYVGAGVCLAVSIFAYHRLIGPALVGTLPLGLDWLAGVGLAVVIGSGLQALEVFPRLETYFPDLAEQLTVKLKLNPVPSPRSDRHSPSLLPLMNDRTKKAQEGIFQEMERTGTVSYGIESIGSLWTFSILTAAGTLNVAGVIGALISIFGFEVCLKFATMMRSLRLNARESRKFREHKRRLMADSAADLNS